MQCRLTFDLAYDITGHSPARGYRFRVVRDDGARLKFTSILTDEVRTELIGQGIPAQGVDDLLHLFTLIQFERVLRTGAGAPPSGQASDSSANFDVTPNHFPQIVAIAKQKECRCQRSEGSDFYCSATDGDIPIPITPPICRECLVPETRWICSHLAHPVSGIEVGADGECQSSPRAMCNRNQPEILDLDQCRPGGNKCWERIVEPEIATRSRAFAPEALPEALDFLDATWRLAFGRHHLVRLRSAADTAALVAPCRTRKDFVACMSALDDIIKSMTIDDEFLSDTDKVNQNMKGDKTLNRLTACLQHNISDLGQRQSGIDAIGVLRTANRIRVALQHSGNSEELPKALASLDISPNHDFGERWTTIRTRVTEALIDIRKAVADLADLQ
jgi:hypothetical protein